MDNSPNQKIYNDLELVDSITDVLSHPAAPGNALVFKDKYENYIYTKTRTNDMLSKPEYHAYEIKEVNFEDLLPENKRLANFVTNDQFAALTSIVTKMCDKLDKFENMFLEMATAPQQSVIPSNDDTQLNSESVVTENKKYDGGNKHGKR